MKFAPITSRFFLGLASAIAFCLLTTDATDASDLALSYSTPAAEWNAAHCPSGAGGWGRWYTAGWVASNCK